MRPLIHLSANLIPYFLEATKLTRPVRRSPVSVTLYPTALNIRGARCTQWCGVRRRVITTPPRANTFFCQRELFRLPRGGEAGFIVKKLFDQQTSLQATYIEEYIHSYIYFKMLQSSYCKTWQLKIQRRLVKHLVKEELLTQNM